MTYFDTSVLLSLYVFEPHNSTRAAIEFQRTALPIPVNSFQLHEVRTAMRAQHFRKQIEESTAAASLSRLHEDIASGVLVWCKPRWSTVFRLAESLSAEYTITTGNRSSDILHVALAQEMGAAKFVTFDRR